jgi:signal transduction histidine kinase
MKSIRRTLVVNVTLLLVLALSTVAALVYGITHAAITDRQDKASELVRLQFKDERDEAMLNQARALADDAQSQFDPVKFRQYFETAAALSFSLPAGPNAHVAAPIWFAERVPGWLSWQLNLRLATDIKLSDSEWANDGYVQVNTDMGNIWSSKALSGPPLAMDIHSFDPDKRIEWIFDDFEATPGVKVRRVRLKAPLTRFRILAPSFEVSAERASLGIAGGLHRDPARPERVVGPSWFNDPRGIGRRVGPGGRSGPLPGSPTAPTLYIQIVWDGATNAPTLARFVAKRDAKLAELADENQRSMASLRTGLIWLGAAAFAVAVIGGWLLVGLGLAPLKRLSDAVSRVSAKDFKLPIEPKELPVEVSPVADRLKLTLQQLQEAFAREKRASADISHELRTPLAALTTTLEVALRKPRSNEDYRQTLEDARQIARQMSQLVERMLMLAWLDAGADEVRPEAVDVDELVEGCAAIGKPLAEAQGLRFQVSAEHPLTVRTDPDKLREVVMNLLHNAIEYNRPGGEVIISATTNGNGIVVEVLDTGIGIPPELQGKIFERFYRGDPSRNAAGVHAGLGLAIVKEYVDRLGGRLSLESAVGAGSRFRVELPNV